VNDVTRSNVSQAPRAKAETSTKEAIKVVQNLVVNFGEEYFKKEKVEQILQGITALKLIKYFEESQQQQPQILQFLSPEKK